MHRCILCILNVAWQREVSNFNWYLFGHAEIRKIIKMGVDYYKILSLTRSATDADIKKA